MKKDNFTSKSKYQSSQQSSGKPNRYLLIDSQYKSFNPSNSARYSDVSSLEMRQMKKPSKSYVYEMQQNNLEREGRTMKKEQIQSECSIAEQSQSLNNIFGEADSLLDIANLVSEAELSEIAKEAKVDPFYRKLWGYNFYKKGKKQAEGYHLLGNRYYVDYLQWKQKSEQNCGQLSKQIKQQTNDMRERDDDDEIKATIIKKQIEWQRYKDEQYRMNQQQREKEMKIQMEEISKEYQHKFREIMGRKVKFVGKEKREDGGEEGERRKEKQLGFERIEYPVISMGDRNPKEEIQKQQQLVKLRQLNERCFMDIIRNPPKVYGQQLIDDACQKMKLGHRQEAEQKRLQNMGNRNEKDKLSGDKYQLRLDINKIMTIPHRQYLLFYTQHEHKLSALASPSQFRALTNYRTQAIHHQQAISRLKDKLAEGGTEMISRLSQQKRQKLFKLLYEDEVEEEVRDMYWGW